MTKSNSKPGGAGWAAVLLLVLALNLPTARAQDTADNATNNPAADKAWREVTDATRAPMPPAEWRTNAPSDQQVAGFYGPLALKAADLARDFYTRYPEHPKAGEARSAEYGCLRQAVLHFGITNQAARLVVVETERLKDPKLGDQERANIQQHRLGDRMAAIKALGAGLPDTLAEMEQAARALLKDYPDRVEPYEMLLSVAKTGGDEKFLAMLKELATGSTPDAIKQQVANLLKQQEENERIKPRMAEINELATGLPDTAKEMEKAARALLKDFPGRIEPYQALLTAAEAGGDAKFKAMLKEFMDGSAPPAVKQQAAAILKRIEEDIRMNPRLAAIGKLVDRLPATAAETEKAVRELLKDFPNRMEPYRLLLLTAKMAGDEKLAAVTAELSAAPLPDPLRPQINSLARQLALVGKPLSIQFTALDGREVDLAKLKGKVVLVDFWATWCGPCVAAMPEIKAAYDKLHARGFEVVGISLDDNQQALERFIAKQHLEWPQFFDGKNFQNKYARQYEVEGIPAMWLVDKKGSVRDVNAIDGLEAKVAKLLAEPAGHLMP